MTASSLLPHLPLTRTNPTTYTTSFPPTFTIGSVPHGGYISSAFLHVARHHFRSLLSPSTSPDPSILQLNFLRRTNVEPATFVVRDVKIGQATSIIHVTLKQNNVEEVVAYVTHINRQTQRGITLQTDWGAEYKTPGGWSPSLLQRQEEEKSGGGWREVTSFPFAGFRRATAHVELWMPSKELRQELGLARGRVDQWMRMRSGERWTGVHLGYLADYFPLLIEFLEGDSDDTGRQQNKKKKEDNAGAKFWYPTLVLNLEIKKPLPEEGVEWLRSVVQMRHVRDGRNDLEVVIFDAEGDLVAVSHHVCLVVPVERNVSARRKDRVNVVQKRGDGKSKI